MESSEVRAIRGTNPRSPLCFMPGYMPTFPRYGRAALVLYRRNCVVGGSDFFTATLKPVPPSLGDFEVVCMPAHHYNTDFFAWTREQSALIRARRWSEIDVEHLAEEVEDMGKSEKRALESRLEVLLMHLLKWQVQKDRRSNSWRRTIKDQRRRLEKHLNENPSLKAVLLEVVEDVYPSAIVAAANETGLDDEQFPADCPYSVGQILDADYLPE